MTEQQQKLYDKLLKKVNEYCLGQAAEDVIAAIDALVDDYESEIITITSCATRYTEVLTILKKYLEPKMFQFRKPYMGITVGRFHASYEVLRKEWYLLREVFTNESTN